jgi:hypothetical protein
MISALGPSNNYFGLLSDNGSFCIHNGTYPDADYGELWCATTGLTQREMEAHTSQSQRILGAYPTDCTLRSWQGTNHPHRSFFLSVTYTHTHVRMHSHALSLSLSRVEGSWKTP